jgi:hypothetical protein
MLTHRFLSPNDNAEGTSVVAMAADHPRNSSAGIVVRAIMWIVEAVPDLAVRQVDSVLTPIVLAPEGWAG